MSSLTMKNIPEKKGFGIGGLVTSIIGLAYGSLCLVACVACAYACGTASSSVSKDATKNATEAIVKEESNTNKNTTNNNTPNNSMTNNNAVDNNSQVGTSNNSADFRKWVDDYENWVNEYVEFMNNYNPTDMSQLTKYSKLLTEYSKWAADTGKLKESDYSPEDWQYFLNAQLRVNEKLATVTQKIVGQ